MKIEYISLVISFIAALAWIPSLVEVLKRKKYVITANLKDTVKLRNFKRFMDGQDRAGFVLIIAVDFWIEEPQGGAFYVNEINVKVKFKGDSHSYTTLYLNELEYKQMTGVPEPIKKHVVFSNGTNIRDVPNISWNQCNLKILPLFIPGDTEKYSGKYGTIEWIKIKMASGTGRKYTVNVRVCEEYQEKGLIMGYIKPV